MPWARGWAVNTPIHTYRAPIGHLGEPGKPTQNVRAIVPMGVRRHSRHITVRAARRRYD
jgi:hypothetical protein